MQSSATWENNFLEGKDQVKSVIWNTPRTRTNKTMLSLENCCYPPSYATILITALETIDATKLQGNEK